MAPKEFDPRDLDADFIKNVSLFTFPINPSLIKTEISVHLITGVSLYFPLSGY